MIRSVKKFDKMADRKNLKTDLIKNARFEGIYDFPKLDGTRYIPRQVIPFNAAMSEKEPNGKWIHFFIDDYQFERIWSFPDKYLPVLSRFEGVITTDFSMFENMPKAQRIWNCYRNRVMAYYMQRNNLNIVPVVEWADFSDLEWCLDGLPKCSSLAIGTYGCNQKAVKRYGLIKGVEKICTELMPSALIVYGDKIPAIETIHKKVIWIENYCKKIKKRV